MASKSNKKSTSSKLRVETIIHDEATRKNIPTAEYQSIMQKTDQTPIQVAYDRRNRDLDPQLVWRGKDNQNWSDLVVSAPPLYIQEKVHPKALIDDLLRQSKKTELDESQINLFADFNGLPNEGAKTEFYQHDSHWSNRMILGDSLQVMASLAEREGLRGKVQCIYLDPPYGIKFNSNFQWSTTNRDVKDGNTTHITREPEQVKAFRDTWCDGIHTYLTYLRDRLTVAKDLLNESGSIFVQIGDENVHRVRALLDEVFGDSNFVSEITVKKTGGLGTSGLKNVTDFILWYAKDHSKVKFRKCFLNKADTEIDAAFTSVISSDGKIKSFDGNHQGLKEGEKVFRTQDLNSSGLTPTCVFDVNFEGRVFKPVSGRSWKTNQVGMSILQKAGRLISTGSSLRFLIDYSDFPVAEISNLWSDTGGSVDRIYVVQTSPKVIQRCLLMATDPGDLVLDPTCGSGTTAFVSEQWGRRWITIDTSRVALALARARIMGSKFSYYYLADSPEGKEKIAEITRSIPTSGPTFRNIKHGFVYERAPHITLGSIARDQEIGVIWESWQSKLEPIRQKINSSLKKKWEEWEIPRECESNWEASVKKLHNEWWTHRISRQKEIDASISAKAEFEYLYDKPYIDKTRIRVSGPFTVESVSPHKVLGVNSDDTLIDPNEKLPKEMSGTRNFIDVILENLRTAGVQQAHKDDKITFTSISPWPGQMICAEGRYIEGTSNKEKRAAIFIGPEFGTVSRVDLVEAAKEAGDSDFEVLIACAFNFDARASEFSALGKIPVLKARMNADLHMADDLKNTGKGNLFVIFGEPDIEMLDTKKSKIRVKINGVDVFQPNTGEVKSDGADGIACWFVDTDYNEESFFVRHAYFLGAGDPYKSLKTSLKAEIDKEAWESLNSDTSRPFEKPESGRIAVKVINHLGDEVMKVFKVP